MFHNHTNQLPLFFVNRSTPNEPPPRYTRRERSNLNFDGTLLCLGTVLVSCVLILLFMLVLGQVLIFHQLERIGTHCFSMETVE